MKAAIALTTLFTLVAAHDAHANHARFVKRQATSSAASSSVASTTSSAASSATSSSSASSTGSGSSSTSATSSVSGSASVTTSAASVGTSLVGTSIPPLSEITSGAPSQSTQPLTSTYTAGQTPSIDGAPALPTWSLVVSDWPTMDKVPPTDSDEVTEWMKELDGFDIPDLDVTDGSCAGSPTQAADAQNRGWWSCGGYTRDTDIVSCPDKLTWGMSFDDGPGPYTPKLLEYLDEKDLHATFFVVGSRVLERPDALRDEYMSGHEISLHTWSHRPLTSLTNEEIVAEFGWTRRVISEVIGVTPTTMRPPYGDIDDRVRAIALAMGMVPIIWTRGPQNNQFDTNDWKVPGGVVTGEQSVQAFEQILGNATEIDTGFIVLEHDLYQQTVDLAVGYTLDKALSYNPTLTLKAIGECQGWPNTDMYLETTTNTTFPYPDSVAANAATTTASARATAVGSSQSSNSGAQIGLVVPKISSMLVGVSVLVGGLFILA